MRACKTCGTSIPGTSAGRPRLTCSESCGRSWANAKRRASRARTGVLAELERAARASNEVSALWERVTKLQRWVERQDPRNLAEILERDREQFPPDVGCVWPKSAL